MKVFIENEAGKDQKNLHNEKTLAYKETITVARKYPYPYGFVLNTTSADGDNVDVFVLTDKILKRGDIVDCKAIALMEQIEQSWDASNLGLEEVDHNVIAVLADDKATVLTEKMKEELTEFVLHVFDNIRKNKTKVGRFCSKAAAINYINQCKDKC